MFDYLAMAYNDSDYTIVIAGVRWLKRTFSLIYIGAGVMSAFVFLSAAVAQALASTFVGGIALKVPLHAVDQLHSEKAGVFSNGH